MDEVLNSYGQGSYIPVIDFSLYRFGTLAERQQFASQIQFACTKIGFFYLKNHGISQTLLDRLFAQSKSFFSLPLTVKNSVTWDDPESNCGYIGMRTQHLDPAASGDLMEAYNLGLLQPGAETKWIHSLPNFHETLLEFYEVSARVCHQLMAAFVLALGLDEHFFEDKHNQHYSTVRLLHYPPAASGVMPGDIRAGAHSDYGSITLLFQDDIGGLEILHEDAWIPAPYIPGTVVVNTGDLMERWTNNEFRSTKHRVVVPPEPAARNSRYSATMFYRPNLDTEIVCLEPCRRSGQEPFYPPTTTREHLLSCLRASYQVKPEE